MIDEEVYEKLLDNFRLLTGIVGQPKNGPELKVNLSNIEEIINRKIPDTLGKNAPEDFYTIYMDFKAEYERFRDFILYEKLIGKNVIALGGGFSSGKSSFLNALMGRQVLPADIDPSTSVPTYIVSGEKHSVMGINVFDAQVQMQPRDLRKIAHGFGEVQDEDDEKVTEAVTLGHVLENIFFSTPLHKYENVAFLDTPGYSKPDSEEYSAKTDAQIARGQLNSSNYILWFVQADAGTITEADIKFIKTLREDIPKLIIVNKADKKNLKDLREIMEKIRAVLELRGVRYVDVHAFTCKGEQIDDDDLEAFLEEEAEKIRERIGAWNGEVYESNFARNFKALFVRCREFYEDEIEEESRRLTRLNTSITKLLAEDIDSEILEPLQLMVKAAQREVNELKNVARKLKELQDEFFTEIKWVSDVVGIAMPEPSEIDLLQDKVQSPLQMIEDYRRKKGIKANPAILKMLRDIFSDISPVLDQNMDPIENMLLQKETDNIKNSYFKILLLVLCEVGDMSEEQQRLFSRIQTGIKIEGEFLYLLRQVMEFKAEQYEEYMDQLKTKDLRFRLLVDAILLICCNQATKRQIELIAIFMESLKITMEEGRYLAIFGKSILEQDLAGYVEKIQSKANNTINILEKTNQEYMSDIITEQRDPVIVYFPELKELDFRDLFPQGITYGENAFLTKEEKYYKGVMLQGKSFIFRNVVFDMIENGLWFQNCGSVQFINCEFRNGHHAIVAEQVKKLVFVNCRFSTFDSRVIKEIRVDETTIIGCRFQDCRLYFLLWKDEWRVRGGLIYTNNRSYGITKIETTVFQNCGAVNKADSATSAVISNCRCEVKQCSFYNCWSSSYAAAFSEGVIDGRKHGSHTLFTENSMSIGNKFVDSARFN